MSSNGKNPVANPVATMPGRNGGRLRRGGTNPRAGRPPDEHKAFMREILADPEVEKRLRQVLKSKDDGTFLASYKTVAERGYGKPAQVIEGGDERKPLVIRLVREAAS